jgi:DNA-binding NarL/FixJ family response regulator
MRVAIADDSALFRQGLAMLLSEAGVDVIGESRTGAELVNLVRIATPDVVILDIRMPPTFTDEGLRTAQQLRQTYPTLGVLVLSTYAETAYAVRLLETGSDRVGYLLKDRVDDAAALCEALNRIVAGESVIDIEIITRLLARQRTTSTLDRLSPRERDILQLMAAGRSNSGISQQLFLSPKTVESHIAAVFSKLGLATGTESNRRVLAVLTWLRSV